jgi:hypothetical protein
MEKQKWKLKKASKVQMGKEDLTNVGSVFRLSNPIWN